MPVPGVEKDALSAGARPVAFLLFSGGGLATFSIIALGVNPYINASIIMQLMTGVVPRLQQLQREGEYGRNKINQYTRKKKKNMKRLQSYGYLTVSSAQSSSAGQSVLTKPVAPGVVRHHDHQFASLTAGSILLMWRSASSSPSAASATASASSSSPGIVARAPNGLLTPAHTRLAGGLAFAVMAAAAVAIIVYIQEGQRCIPIQYASRVRGRRMWQGGATFLPLRVNQVGVNPHHFCGQHPAVPGTAGAVLLEFFRGRCGMSTRVAA